MRRKGAPRRDRWLSMAEVAELMQVPKADREQRRLHVRRLLRRLEKRDGTSYLRRFGPGRGKLYVAVSALEQLMPWDPGTLGRMRGDVDATAVRVTRLERRVTGHDRELEKLRSIGIKSAELAAAVGQYLGSKADKNRSPSADP